MWILLQVAGRLLTCETSYFQIDTTVVSHYQLKVYTV